MKEPDTNANYEPDELEETNADQDTGQESSSFYDIKEKASMNLSQLLEDLQAFEKAVREEDIPEIYRLYNGRLNEELKRSSNENHEIDQLLMRKIHDRFTGISFYGTSRKHLANDELLQNRHLLP